MTGLTLETALLAAIAPILVALLTVGFASRPASAIPLLLLVQMTASYAVIGGISLGQLNVYPGDILSVGLVAATLARWQQRRVGLRSSGMLILMLVILVFSLVRGAAAFGLLPATNAAREMIAMLAAAIFFSTVRITPQIIRTVRNWLLVASFVLVVVAINFWFQRGFGTYAASGDRALNGLQALIILEATVITILFPPFRGPVLRWVVPLAGIVVVVLSTQRTVWASGVVAAAILVVARPKSSGSTSIAGTRLAVIAGAVAIVLLVAAGPPGATSDLLTGYGDTSSSQYSTFSWRLEGWSILISRQIDGPAVDLVFGSPSGTGEDRVMNGAIVTASSHSQYVSTLTMIGLLGLALLLGVYVTALRGSRRALRSPSPFVGQVALLFIAMLALKLTYSVGYSLAALGGLILGLAYAFVRGNSQDPPSTRPNDVLPATTQGT